MEKKISQPKNADKVMTDAVRSNMEKVVALLEIIDTGVDVAFATSEGDRPKIRSFQTMRRQGSTLYFATSPQKAVYRQLQENPNVEILATADRVSVRCSGAVDFHVDDECKRWIYDHNPVLSRLYSSYDKLAYFSLSIDEMDYYDLRPTPPVFRHFNLIEGTEKSGFVGERFSNK
ncbi:MULTISPECIES: pyridoxamine 5'-phosphate oxidase family protein [Prevotella]|nr:MULTISPECIES: pyridoxamine 5'-phosphate oxidase family protein [Prevotella]